MSCLICSWDLRSQSFLQDLKQILRLFGSWGEDVPRDVERFGRTTNGLCLILDGWVYHIPFCFFFEGGTLLMAVAWSPTMLSETTSWVLGLRHAGNTQQPKKRSQFVKIQGHPRTNLTPMIQWLNLWLNSCQYWVPDKNCHWSTCHKKIRECPNTA